MRAVLALLACCLYAPFVVANPLSEETLSAAGVEANTVKKAMALRDEARAGSRAFEWVERLTTEVGPRLAGSEAEARARTWAVSTLKEMGFDDVRLEPFEIDGWERGIERAAVVAPYPQPLAITALGGSVPTPKGGLQ
ncbi:MAG: peptidase M28 family protein, partial [Halieaceae bacterium]|nr:peptidase M28 family protein [Halieaceae bacterium]